MDPLSALGLAGICMSIIRYATLSSNGLGTLRQRMRDSEQDIEALRAEVDGIRTSTEQFRNWLERNPQLDDQQARVIRRTLDAIEGTLVALERQIGSLLNSMRQADEQTATMTTAGGEQQRQRLPFRRRLSYAWRASDIERYRSRLAAQLQVLEFEYRALTRQVAQSFFLTVPSNCTPVTDHCVCKIHKYA